MKNYYGSKKLFFILLSAVLVIGIVSVVNAQTFGEFSQRSGNVVIIVGDEATNDDMIAADLLLSGLANGSVRNSRHVSIVNPTNVNQANLDNADIIVVGGPCVNSYAADMLGVSYPTCGATFNDNVGIGTNQYLVYTVRMSDLDFVSSELRDSNRMSVLIAGYTGEDTIRAANYVATNPSNIRFLSEVRFDSVAGTNLVHSNNMSYRGNANVNANLNLNAGIGGY